MSITHAQLREFADATKGPDSLPMSRATTSLIVELGLFDKNGITPAGRDAIATVPYLVDAEPVDEAPATPETVECSACDGQGVKRVAHNYELRDHDTGKMSLQSRSNLVVCDAKGCERGRVLETPALTSHNCYKYIRSVLPRGPSLYVDDPASPYFGEPRALRQEDRSAPPVIIIDTAPPLIVEYYKPFDYTHEEIVMAATAMKKQYPWLT